MMRDKQRREIGRWDYQSAGMKVKGRVKRQHWDGEGGVGWGGICGLERRNRGMREGCNAETCQKRAPGPPCGMWPVCLPRKNRAGKREESEKGVKTSFAPSSWREMKGGQGGKTMSRVTEREESEVEK